MLRGHKIRKLLSGHIIAPIIMCGALLISGCATSEDLGKIQWELNELKADVKGVREKSHSIETSMPGQKKQLEQKIRELEATQRSTAKAVSDLIVTTQDLTTEFQVMTGRFEEARYFSEKDSSELHENSNTMSAKLSELELSLNELKKKLGDAEAAAKATAEKEAAAKAEEAAKKPVQADKKAPSSNSSAVKDIYMAGYQAFKKGDMPEAREKFLNIINGFEKNEYSDNARFWIGETYYKEENYEDAILAYEELFKKNPESDKVPGAMLKQGLAFLSLKDKKTGTIILEKLIEKYPDSEQANLAKRKINKPVVPKKKK